MGGPLPPPLPPILNETCVSLYTQNYTLFSQTFAEVCRISVDAVQKPLTYKLMVTFILLFSFTTPCLAVIACCCRGSACEPENIENRSERGRARNPSPPPAPPRALPRTRDSVGYKKAILELHYAPSYSLHRRLHHMYLQTLKLSPAQLRQKENRYIDMRYDDDYTAERRTITIVEDLKKNPAHATQQALHEYDSKYERQRLSYERRTDDYRYSQALAFPPESRVLQNGLPPRNFSRTQIQGGYQASPLVMSMLQASEEAMRLGGLPQPKEIARSERDNILLNHTVGDDAEQVVREMRTQAARRRNAERYIGGERLIEQNVVLPGIDEDVSPPQYVE